MVASKTAEANTRNSHVGEVNGDHVSKFFGGDFRDTSLGCSVVREVTNSSSKKHDHD